MKTPSLFRPAKNENPPAEDERLFLLDQALSFRSGVLDGDVTFSWRDLSGDPGDMWEFVCSSDVVPKATSGVFELTVLQCMYERVSAAAAGSATVRQSLTVVVGWPPAR
jgi:hypothetical protein